MTILAFFFFIGFFHKEIFNTINPILLTIFNHNTGKKYSTIIKYIFETYLTSIFFWTFTVPSIFILIFIFKTYFSQIIILFSTLAFLKNFETIVTITNYLNNLEFLSSFMNYDYFNGCDNYDLYSFVLEDSNQTDSTGGLGNNNTVNVNNPNLAIHTDKVTVNVNPNTITGGIILGGAIRAGVEAAKHSGGSPATKAGVFVGTTVFAAATGGLAKNIYDRIVDGSNNNDNKSSLMANFLDDKLDLLFVKVEGLDQYPLNLLQDMSLFVTAGIIFSFVILNVFISIYLHDKNTDELLPAIFNPKTSVIGKVILFFLNRYNFIYKAKNFLFLYSWCFLILSLLLIRLILFLILNKSL